MEIDPLIQTAIKASYSVHEELGHGFNEKIFENSLIIALTEIGIDAKQQYPLTVSFHGKIVGEFFADVFIEDSLIIELKALTNLNSSHKAQVINYLKASGQETALLINFGAPSLQIKRLYHPN